MFKLKQRVIHAVVYEAILMIIIAVALTFVFNESLDKMGGLSLAMALVSMVWNMIFNFLFERLERRYRLKRTVLVRIGHAIGFEGGLMIVTIPMIAYVMNLSLGHALLLDLSMTLCILVYTFVFQWIYDKTIESLSSSHSPLEIG